jgi:hypothetical protein
MAQKVPVTRPGLAIIPVELAGLVTRGILHLARDDADMADPVSQVTGRIDPSHLHGAALEAGNIDRYNAEPFLRLGKVRAGRHFRHERVGHQNLARLVPVQSITASPW